MCLLLYSFWSTFVKPLKDTILLFVFKLSKRLLCKNPQTSMKKAFKQHLSFQYYNGTLLIENGEHSLGFPYYNLFSNFQKHCGDNLRLSMFLIEFCLFWKVKEKGKKNHPATSLLTSKIFQLLCLNLPMVMIMQNISQDFLLFSNEVIKMVWVSCSVKLIL